MLSGVGDSDHLGEVGVDTIHHLPGVGQNLQDHLEVYIAQGCKKPVSLLKDQKGLRMIKVGIQWFLNRTGSASSSHLETGMYYLLIHSFTWLTLKCTSFVDSTLYLLINEFIYLFRLLFIP